MDKVKMDSLWDKAECPVNRRTRVIHSPLPEERCRTREIVSKAVVNMDHVREGWYYDDGFRLCPHCWPREFTGV